MLMLIDPSAIQKMERAVRLGVRATAEQAAEWYQSRATGYQSTAGLTNMPRNMSVAGDVAEIRVEGVLSEKPDFWSWFLYGANTTYESIRQALALAEAEPNIRRCILYVSSPGGYIDGLFDCLGALEAFEKPKSVRAAYACSAALALATQFGKIQATNEATQVGSVGVVREYFVDEHFIEITSTQAPNKRPDPTTDEGKAVIRAELDAIHDLFVKAIARGRGTTVEDVNANYGRGGVLLAGAAKKVGMIDSIAKVPQRAVTVTTLPEGSGPNSPEAAAPAPTQASDEPPAPPSAAPAPHDASRAAAPKVASAADGGAPTARKKTMTKEELKAQHPELYAAVLKDGKDQGHEEGVKEGTTAERKRAVAHLKLGQASGALDIAFKAIAEGVSTRDEEVSAEYQAAAMKRNAISARQQETDDAGKVVDGAKQPATDKSRLEAFADALEKDADGDL